MKNYTLAMIVGIAVSSTVTLIGAAPAYGASFTGSLNNADDTRAVSFASDGTSTINFKSYGYDGGTNAAGTVIAAGGFSPVLTLFDPADNYIEEQISLGDFNFNRVLPLGNYQAVISTFGNFFEYYNNPNFSAGFPGGGDFGIGRSPEYAFDIVTQSSTSVPEPSSLIGTAVAGFAVIKFKRKLSSAKKAHLKNSV